jgi:starch synthase
MKVLYAASEALPFIASGGLADVAGSLPKAIRQRKTACRVVLPLYKDIKDEYKQNLKFIAHFEVDVAWRKQYCGVFETTVNGVIFYLIDNQYYFDREGVYGFYDDGERYAFFSRAVVEMIKHISFKPDVINCNDWQTALIPIYLNLFYRNQNFYDKIRTVFTIHNIQYQGKFGMDVLNYTFGIPEYAKDIVEFDNCVNLMKGAIELADRVTTVSDTYAKEILDPYFSHGLDRFLCDRKYKLSGILNGIDYKLHDPETDEKIFANYSSKDLTGKKINKQKLLKELGLIDNGEPVIGIVTRLVSHKGLDLIKHVFEDIINSGYKVIVLGSGELMYENFFREMKARFPEKVSVTIGFIPMLAKKIYAGVDMFLMPSKSEPCGLAQMISLRYGTIPIVRETGGLKDTVVDAGDNGNGFTFKSYNAHDMLHSIERAKEVYSSSKEWEALIKKAMASDNSWGKSAIKYIDLYKQISE